MTSPYCFKQLRNFNVQKLRANLKTLFNVTNTTIAKTVLLKKNCVPMVLSLIR